jgi:hypothetical protein
VASRDSVDLATGPGSQGSVTAVKRDSSPAQTALEKATLDNYFKRTTRTPGCAGRPSRTTFNSAKSVGTVLR